MRMGKNWEISEEISKLQGKIRNLLKETGWSVKDFADKYFWEELDSDGAYGDEDDKSRHAEKVKKHLSSSSSTAKRLELLKKYVEFIETSRLYRKDVMPLRRETASGMQDAGFKAAMRKLSSELNELLLKKS